MSTALPGAIGAAMVLIGALAGTAAATENGTGEIGNGAEGLAAGAAPPPGLYLINYMVDYQAGRLNDAAGRSAAPGFRESAAIEVPRLIYMTPLTVLGAAWGVDAYVPYGRLDVRAGGVSHGKTGIGDLTVDPMLLVWHAAPFHWDIGLSITAPTGAYRRQDAANIGSGYWSATPMMGVSYLADSGFETSAKLSYMVNAANPATSYRSGQTAHVDAIIGQAIGDFTAGLGGYWYRQTTPDTGTGAPAGGNYGQGLALGPEVRLLYAGMAFTGKWQHEMLVRNGSEGDKFWLRAYVPL